MIGILHLSDIHIAAESDAILKRPQLIAAAARATHGSVDTWVVACGGDVAQSGKSEEYDLAHEFFDTLAKELGTPRQKLVTVLIPGNHDLDFSEEKQTRQILLTSVHKHLPSVDKDTSMIEALTRVQDNFFKFEARLSSRDHLDHKDRLVYVRDFESTGKSILFRCLNSAWVSRIQEKQGELVFPNQLIEIQEKQYDYSVTLLHHPYNWYQSDNAREIRKSVERVSDLVLTGHEHTGDVYRKTNLDLDSLDYIEAPVLFDRSGQESAFNIILIDLEKDLQCIVCHAWDGARYHSERDSGWRPRNRNSLAQKSLRPVDEFQAWLDDAGTGFNHGKLNRAVKLSDIYVYPDLSEFSLNDKINGKSASQLVRSESVQEKILATNHVLLIGQEKSGKTSLAKRLYVDCLQRGDLYPLFVRGESLKAVHTEDQLVSCLTEAISKQYGGKRVSEYRQLSNDNKVLIIDDFHSSGMNRKGQQRLLALLRECTGRLIVLADEVMKIIELTEQGSNELIDFTRFEIRPSGHRLREVLIRKWLSLGREYSVAEFQLDHEVNQAQQLVQTLLGRNLIPAFPVNVLTILQLSESSKLHNLESGSYGNLYSALITISLSQHGSSPADLDTKVAYLSHVAYTIFESGSAVLSEKELDVLTSNYFSEYKISFDRGRMTSDLISARILQNSASGYQFRYKYAYYYFVAKYFQDALGNVKDSSKIGERLRGMADQLVFEDYANILMFYVYLTKDRSLIEHLLANASQIYSEHIPLDLNKDIEFINKLIKEPPRPLALPESSVHDNRDRYNESRDRESDTVLDDSNVSRQIEYHKDLDDFTKINIALKTLQIVGQVVRNFPGSLRGDLKHSLTLESYLLALRTSRAILGLAERQLPELRQYFASLIKEHRAIADQEQLALEADELVVWLANGSVFGMLKRVSHAVGLERLAETFGDVLEGESDEKVALGFEFIDIAIKLDHFANPPIPAIKRLARRLELSKNWFSLELLRQLVANYLYLYHVETPVRQQLGDTLGIKGTSPKMLLNPEKR
jgi:hypothetical protein